MCDIREIGCCGEYPTKSGLSSNRFIFYYDGVPTYLVKLLEDGGYSFEESIIKTSFQTKS